MMPGSARSGSVSDSSSALEPPRILWAKSGADGRWHCLPCHLLDVASTAQVLWLRLAERSRSMAVESFENEHSAQCAAIFLAGAHDVGKCNRFFQAKAPEQRSRLMKSGINLPPPSNPECRGHGFATGVYLCQWLQSRWNWSQFIALQVARAVGGHHGTFYTEDSGQINCLETHKEPWCSLGVTLLDDLAQVLNVGSAPPPQDFGAFLGWLAGFVCVADWLGSHAEMTVWETTLANPGQYLEQALRRAEALLDRVDWQAPPAGMMLRVKDFLPAQATPNSLQQLAESISQNVGLAIVEAPTGEGKTEAAFALAEPVRAAGNGAYFALPTMATANGLYERVHAYLGKATAAAHLDTRLLHSMAWLYREETKTAPNPGQEGVEQQTAAEDWFAGSKRGLLAPYGVGTIDQALIAALRTRHGFVRLFALAGKVVVVDEVHAYDVYMGDLLETLLGWLRALNCRVVLLSATLPAARRKALLAAWAPQATPPESKYPCITWARADGTVHSESFEVKQRKPVAYCLLPEVQEEQPLWQQGATLLLQRLVDAGGLGALILNTVGEAQAAFRWLSEQNQNANKIELMLFHARFTAQDRSDIEKRVLARFGKSGPRDRPALLVATQVVEQSLDLDFDWMVSALAPVDLLIQRAGRLHRHRRRAGGCLRKDGGPDERPASTLEVLAPRLDEAGTVDKNTPVYNGAILQRTLAWLEGAPVLRQPADVAAAVEAVYAEELREAALQQKDTQLAALEGALSAAEAKHHRVAKRVRIPDPTDEDCFITESSLEMDENDERHDSQLAARTRLEDRPSLTLVILDDRDEALTIHGASALSARDCVLASVKVSPPYPLWSELLLLEPLAGWSRSGALKRMKPLRLGNGEAPVGEHILNYSHEIGLEWRKSDAVVQTGS